jgi:hypothetical protein
MSDDTPSPLNNVITIDDERIKSHLDRVVRGTVEEALNALLDTEADRLFIPDPIANTNRIRINTLALGARLPTLHGLREYVEAGPDILWTKRPKPVPSCRQLGREILRGWNPGDMPIEQPTKFDLVINLTTAKTLDKDFSNRRQASDQA